MSFVLTFLLLLCPLGASAETEWEKWLESIMQDGDFSEAQYEEMYEGLLDMQRNKININHTTREELEALPFLNSQQVMDIMEYIDRTHSLKSLTELMSIESIDYQTRQLLYEFLYVGESEKEHFPSLADILHKGRNELSLYGKIPTYKRAGDASDGAYLGYPYKFWTRYSFDCYKHVRLGFIAAQDAGEPFFTKSNKQGFDQYSGYLMLSGIGRVEALVVGRYSMSAGMGVVMNTGFSIGKTSVLQNMGRQRNVLRPHTSASESGYLQGAAATVRLTENIHVTPFLSYRKVDATLNKDGTVSTLLYSGYHRTTSEIKKKHNTSMSAAGMNVAWDCSDFSLGATAVYTHISRPLNPNKNQVYKKIYPEGSDFMNVGVNYSWQHYPFSVNGEMAVNGDGAVAMVNSLGYYVSDYVDITGIYRFYSFKYNSLYANAFSEGGKVQNESGAYLGINWHPHYGLDFTAYTDFAYFAWPRYGASQSSYACDNVVSASWKTGDWHFSGRYRLHLRQKNGTSSSVLEWQTEHRTRMAAEWTDGTWTSKSQIDVASASSPSSSASNGYMITENIGYSDDKWSIYAGGKYFHTDNYDSRLYAYERAIPHTFSYPAYYGHGIRYSLVADWKPTASLQFTAKAGVTDYFDRSTIGSSYQQINASSACDIELAMRLRW